MPLRHIREAMIIDGKEYERDRKGFYRCSYPDCHHPDYPARKLKTDAGFIKHLGECKARPDGTGSWKPAPKQDKILFGLCPCGEVIYEGDSVGMRGDHEVVVCYSCWLEGKLTESHLDCAGLRFPEITLTQ